VLWPDESTPLVETIPRQLVVERPIKEIAMKTERDWPDVPKPERDLLPVVVYYAHSVGLYGTPQEMRDVRTLKIMFCRTGGDRVYNPNNPHAAAGYGRDGMDHFRPLVTESDVLAFRADVDGRIPAGVAKEIEWAKTANVPVVELASCVLARRLDVDQTRERLEEGGRR
jgi:hypothetical protein